MTLMRHLFAALVVGILIPAAALAQPNIVEWPQADDGPGNFVYEQAVIGSYFPVVKTSTGNVRVFSFSDAINTVPEIAGTVAQLAAGDNFVIARTTSPARIVAWGVDDHGQVSGAACPSPCPAYTYSDIAAGGQHGLGIRTFAGTTEVFTWGRNDFGQADVPAGLVAPVEVSAGEFHSLVRLADGTVRAWGRNNFGQSSVPVDLSGVTQISAGDSHSLALLSNGTVRAWGNNNMGQSSVPSGLSNVVQVAAGGSYSLALLEDGSLITWGIPTAAVPDGLSDIVSIGAGTTQAFALLTDGTVVNWGDTYPETTPPHLNDVVHAAHGSENSMALKADGSIVTWGRNDEGQNNVPANLSNVIQLAGGYGHSLALMSDGTVVAWGELTAPGELNAVPAGLTDVVQIDVLSRLSLALRADGTVVAWGPNDYGQADPPADLDDVVQVASGGLHGLALRTDGSVVAWGYDEFGQSSVPADLTDVVYVSASVFGSAAIRADGSVVQWGNVVSAPGNLGPIVQISSQQSPIALKSDGTVTSWGGIIFEPAPELDNVVEVGSSLIGSSGRGFAVMRLEGDPSPVLFTSVDPAETGAAPDSELSFAVSIEDGDGESVSGTTLTVRTRLNGEVISETEVVNFSDATYTVHVPADATEGDEVEVLFRATHPDRRYALGEYAKITVGAVSTEGVSTPAAFALTGLYPNPSAGPVALTYDLPEAAEVTVEVYDLLGRLVQRNEVGTVVPGASRQVDIQPLGLSAGTYMVRLVANGASGVDFRTERFTVVR